MFSRMFCITGTFLLSLLAAGCSSQEVSALRHRPPRSQPRGGLNIRLQPFAIYPKNSALLTLTRFP